MPTFWFFRKLDPVKFLSISFYVVLMSHQLTKKNLCAGIMLKVIRYSIFLASNVEIISKYINIYPFVSRILCSSIDILETLNSFNECISDNICNYSMKMIVTLILH